MRIKPTQECGAWRKAGLALALAALQLSAVAELTPPKPTCSQGSFLNYVRVNWTETSGAVAYWIVRGTSTDYHSAIVLGYADSAPVKDYDVKPGVTYYYWVCPSEDGTFEDSWYDSSKYAKGYAKKPVVSKITASDGTKTAGVVLTWKQTSGATLYGIYRSVTKSFSDAVLLGTVNHTGTSSYKVTDDTAVPGKKYYYWLSALVNGYEFRNSTGDVGWRRIVLQLYTPYSALISDDGTETAWWRLLRNGTAVAASKVTAKCSPKNCAKVTRYSAPDDDNLSGSITGKKKGKLSFSAKCGSLTINSQNINIIKSSTLVSTVYGK